MPLPIYSQKSVLRIELATRLGFGANSAASLNTALLNSFLVRSQELLWRRIDWPQLFDQVDHTVAPGELSIDYPTELDPGRITAIEVDTSGAGQWVGLFEGITPAHDTVQSTTTWPRRYERQHDYLFLWPTCSTRRSVAITGITQANPAVVAALAHGLVDGERVRITGVGGMVQVADGVYTVDSPPDVDHFKLNDASDVPVNSTAYTAYSGGGTVSAGYKLRFEGIRRLAAFVSDSDTPSIPDDLLLEQALVYGKAHYRHPDYKLYAMDMRRRLELLSGQAHGNRRYVPVNKRDVNRAPSEAIRPALIPASITDI